MPGESLGGEETAAQLARFAAENAELRLKMLGLNAEIVRLRGTIAYQLGSILLQAKSPRGLWELPGALWRLRGASLERQGKRRKPGGRDLDPATEIKAHRLRAQALELAPEVLVQQALDILGDGRSAMRLIGDLAVAVRPLDFPRSLALARLTAVHDASPHRKVWLAGFLYDAGMLSEPHALFQTLEREGARLSENVQKRRDLIDGMVRVRDQGLAIPRRRAHRGERDAAPDRSVMYVAASSFPHHITGYAARTQSLIKAVMRQGWRVEAVTRPGYPHDRNDAAHVTGPEAVSEVDGVLYHRLEGPPSNGVAFDAWTAQASTALLRHIEKTRPAIVHAASNYLNAAPALVAARKAGLPFVYEVRGLWELTSAARVPHWEGSERFEFQRDQETLIARKADAVVAISAGLRQELIDRGIDARKIVVAPNSVDTDVFAPRPRDRALAQEVGLAGRRVLGFVGSMTGYEGLADLVSALARLRAEGLDVCALLVGDGPAFREVREAAQALGVLDHLVMPGRVPPADVPRWYSLMDVAVYPRRPSRVTELVPPLKPLEAMSMELPVVASNVSAISETITDQRNGFLFEKGDVGELTRLLSEILNAPARARQIGRMARRDVASRFTWAGAAERLDAVYTRHIG